MMLQIVNPADYPQWDSLLLRGLNPSFFCSSAWARVLEKTYCYRPLYFVEFESGEISLLMPFMEIRSVITGKGGISLPFTDRCQPTFPLQELLNEATQASLEYGRKARWDYIEWRDTSYFSQSVMPSAVYYAHELDLTKTTDALRDSLRGSNQRSIKKAVREGVTVSFSQSFEAVESFYRLYCKTRRRHGLPPQSFAFFKNVHENIISKDFGSVVSASYSGITIASSMFFHFGPKAIFKYGASNIKYQRMRPNNLIMWEAVLHYKNRSFTSLSLGRTDPSHQGLLQYKRAWGASEYAFNYFRYDFKSHTFVQKHPLMPDLSNSLLSRLPILSLRLMGRLFNKHFG